MNQVYSEEIQDQGGETEEEHAQFFSGRIYVGQGALISGTVAEVFATAPGALDEIPSRDWNFCHPVQLAVCLAAFTTSSLPHEL